MEKSFDLGFVYRKHEKKHKGRSTLIFQKRLTTHQNHRRSWRSTIFDNARPLSPVQPIPEKVDDKQLKIEHRRKQLEKWKEEKEKRKKEEASMKKKPFVTGVVHKPLNYVPQPPLRSIPSTSGRVTRSQTKNNNSTKPEPKGRNTKTAPKSFAPKTAEFKPPQLKNPITIPKFGAVNATKATKNVKITFDPILPKKVDKTTKHNVEPVNTKSSRSTRLAARNEKLGREILTPKVSPRKTRKSKPLESSESSTDIQKPTALKPTPKRRISRTSIIIINSDEKENIPQKPYKTPLTISSSDSQDSIILPTRHTPRKSTPMQHTPLLPTKDSRRSLQITPSSESKKEEKLKSPKDIEKTPETEKRDISPCVTLSRGKDKARKEMKEKLRQGLLDEDASDAEGVQHFRRQLDSEIQRMTFMCDKWDEISKETTLPGFVQELVLSAIGQARLLMSKKMQQFSTLIDRCEARDANSGPLVTPADLRGFWDMIFIQIENIDMRFKMLDKLQSSNWVEEKKQPEKKKAAAKPKVKINKPAGNSKIREMIEAARKAKKAQESSCSSSSTSSLTSQTHTQGVTQDKSPTQQGVKTFDAGFFCVKSPVRSPLPNTPRNKDNLLKNVLSSEAKRASGSTTKCSFAMLRASVLSKNMDMEGFALLEQTPKKLSPINLDATPARSILKSAAKSARKSSKKPFKTVLFDDSDNEITQGNVSATERDNNIADRDANIDSGMSSMDVDNKENQSKRRGKLVRQEATENSPVMTRNRRKSQNTPVTVDSDKKSTSRRKNNLESSIIENENREGNYYLTPRRSIRNSKVADLIDLSTPTPKKATPKTRRQRGKKTD